MATNIVKSDDIKNVCVNNRECMENLDWFRYKRKYINSCEGLDWLRNGISNEVTVKYCVARKSHAEVNWKQR